MVNIQRDKIAGALYGVAVGDALGAPLEFMSASEIKNKYGIVTDMIGGGYRDLKPGETTDDTAMTLAVAEGIIENPSNPIPCIGRKFIQWVESGPKDIGSICKMSIDNVRRLKGNYFTSEQWSQAAQETNDFTGGMTAGNGALMRTIYPALFYTDEIKAYSITGLQNDMTHYSGESRYACMLYTKIIHYFLFSETMNYSNREKLIGLNSLLSMTLYNAYNLERDIRYIDIIKPNSYVVNSFKYALYSLYYRGSFEDTLVAAVNFGGDADTIGAICGGMAGALYGFEAIPDRWTSALSDLDRRRIDFAIEAAIKNWLELKE